MASLAKIMLFSKWLIVIFSIGITTSGAFARPLGILPNKKTTTFFAHDDKNDCGIGDTVRISETRPMSKNKRWRMVEIIERAK